MEQKFKKHFIQYLIYKKTYFFCLDFRNCWRDLLSYGHIQQSDYRSDQLLKKKKLRGGFSINNSVFCVLVLVSCLFLLKNTNKLRIISQTIIFDLIATNNIKA